MAISGIDSLFGSQELTETERLRRDRESKGALGQRGRGVDTVSLSDEGKRLAAEMQARKAREQESGEREEAAGQDPFAAAAAGVSPDENDEERAEGVAGGRSGAGAGGGSGSSSQVEQIKKQIQQLEAKMQSVASSGLPENIKESTIATCQAQIAELQSQLQQAQRG